MEKRIISNEMKAFVEGYDDPVEFINNIFVNEDVEELYDWVIETVNSEMESQNYYLDVCTQSGMGDVFVTDANTGEDVVSLDFEKETEEFMSCVSTSITYKEVVDKMLDWYRSKID